MTLISVRCLYCLVAVLLVVLHYIRSRSVEALPETTTQGRKA